MIEQFDTAADPHRAWLNDRNQIVSATNVAPCTDEQLSELITVMRAIERRINDTPARTADGLIAKMVLALQVVAEGHELSDEEAADIVREAQCLLDIGSLAGASDEIQMRRAA